VFVDIDDDALVELFTVIVEGEVNQRVLFFVLLKKVEDGVGAVDGGLPCHDGFKEVTKTTHGV